MTIAICICTHQRPKSLEYLLRSLEPLAHKHDIRICLVDNHHKKEGLGVVDKLKQSNYGISIRATAAAEGGISDARNRVLSLAVESQAQFAALIDDDEWPEANWLDELLRIQAIDDVDAVGGPTKAVFEVEVPATLKACPYYGADLGLEDNASCKLEACGNVLLKLSSLSTLAAPWFDPRLGQSGGEDLEFFHRLAYDGMRMRWAKHAIVNERVPASRSTEAWLHQRVALIANTRVHIMSEKHPSPLAKFVRCAKAFALAIQYTGCKIGSVINPQLDFKAFLIGAKFHGKFQGHLGRRLVRGEQH